MTIKLSAKLREVLIFAVIFSLILIFAYPIWAQESRSGVTSRSVKIDTLKERLATREAALKAKLQAFKDKKKAEVTERISTNLNRINQNMTEQMLKFLDNATRILNKLEKRVNDTSPDVKDVTAAKAAIAQAKVAIEEAKAVVSAQAEKDYTVTVTSEGKVRTDVKKVRDGLHADLKAAREAVIKAKQAVGNALRVTKSGKIEVPKEGTPSGR